MASRTPTLCRAHASLTAADHADGAGVAAGVD